MMKFLKNTAMICLWISGGWLIGHSFSSINSFSAEMLFTLGVFIAGLGFYIGFQS